MPPVRRNPPLPEELAYPLTGSDTARFFAAYAAVEADRARDGIGLLAEKCLHATLKRYIEPDPAFHEQRRGRFVADVLREGEITEIQTRAPERLRQKLSFFLGQPDIVRLTVVIPVIACRYLRRFDPATGAFGARRRSPLHQTPLTALASLWGLREWLCHPKLRVCLFGLEAEEYRYPPSQTGWRRRARRCELLPLRPLYRCDLTRAADFAALLPPLPESGFTAGQIMETTSLDSLDTSSLLRTLCEIGAVERVGKRGRAFLYRKKEEM